MANDTRYKLTEMLMDGTIVDVGEISCHHIIEGPSTPLYTLSFASEINNNMVDFTLIPSGPFHGILRAQPFELSRDK